MKIASPPMKLITLAYFIAILVPKVPRDNQKTTAIKLKIAKPKGLTPAATPCAAKIKFSMFPKINNTEKVFNSEPTLFTPNRLNHCL